MKEQEAFNILLVRHLELKTGANFACHESGAEQTSRKPADMLSVRAESCLESAEAQFEFSATSMFATYKSASAMATFLPMAILFLAGAFSNYPGSGGRVNLLFNAVTGYLLWTMFVYLFMAVRSLFFSNITERAGNSVFVQKTAGWLQSATAWLFRTFGGTFQEDDKNHSSIISGFLNSVRDELPHYFLLRARAVTHLWAISLATGILAGLYLRGLAINFEFFWQSTFITGSGFVELLMRIICAPGMLLSGAELPTVAARGVSMPGAEWIHLFALSLTGYAIIPRLALYLFTSHRAKQLLKKEIISIDDDYFRDVIFKAKAATAPVTVLVYGFSIGKSDERSIRGEIAQQLGGSVEAEMHSLSWGDLQPPEGVETSGFLAVVFNGIQTPETDIHGVFLSGCASKAGAGVLVLVDLSNLNQERYQSRRKTWSQFLSSHKIPASYRFITAPQKEEQ